MCCGSCESLVSALNTCIPVYIHQGCTLQKRSGSRLLQQGQGQFPFLTLAPNNTEHKKTQKKILAQRQTLIFVLCDYSETMNPSQKLDDNHEIIDIK